MSETKTDLPTFGELEEDDEFQEFEEQDWADVPGEQVDEELWDQDWDDDVLDDEFSVQLREELAKMAPNGQSS